MNKIINHLVVKILAALLLFLGFGMIHASSSFVEKMGSVFIGLGAFYFLILLGILTQKKEK